MLSIARCCTRVAPRSSPVKSSFANRIFYSTTLKNQSTTPPVSLLERTRLFQTRGGLRRTATLAVRYASASGRKSTKIVGSWLLICGGMVFVAVALGGVTRLTESGLSMVNWELLGEGMPMSESRWIREFERYKDYPEYKITNKGMSLEEFKRIWWMEYAHRMWGRLIGITFALPAGYFWAKGMLTPAMKKRVVILGSLIGLQGLMGWYMVKSGLEDRFDGPSDVPRVSQYRLASHLALAFVIYAGFLYNALELLSPAKKPDVDYFGTKKMPLKLHKGLVRFKKIVYTTKGLVFLTAISGAFVAGLDAGMIYNTFPKMAGRWIPQDLLAYTPIFKNFTENPTTAQFDHRILGVSTLTLITLLGVMSRWHKLPGRGGRAVAALICAGYLQVLMGIITLKSHVMTSFAAIHQSGSLVLLSAATWLCHELKHVKRVLK